MNIKEMRIVAVEALRTNPEGYEQCSVSLRIGDHYRCALGVIAQALNIEVEDNPEDDDDNRAYDELISIFGDHDVSYIWSLNDRKRMSFALIADDLEGLWNLKEDNA